MFRRLMRLLSGRRRTAPVAAALPGPWSAVLARTVRCFSRLTPDHQATLRRLTAAFLAEKTFIPYGGLALTDEIRVCVAGNACVLLIGLPDTGVFPRLHEIIIHRSGFGRDIDAVAPDGRRVQIHDRKAGEAWRRGPVVLAWDEVRRSIASPHDGYNVVFHEFAHVLDHGAAELPGTPLLESKEHAAAWARVFGEEFEAFRRAERAGGWTFIDPYGAQSPAEFFAVVTEHFFEQPRELLGRHPRLYAQLRRLYRQDPARWTTPPAAPPASG